MELGRRGLLVQQGQPDPLVQPGLQVVQVLLEAPGRLEPPDHKVLLVLRVLLGPRVQQEWWDPLVLPELLASQVQQGQLALRDRKGTLGLLDRRVLLGLLDLLDLLVLQVLPVSPET